MEDRTFRVRLELIVDVDAVDGAEACAKAADQYHVDLDDHRVNANILHTYRMPVAYFCCEEGRSWGYEYEYAKNKAEAKFLFQDKWEPDIESSPDFDDIEEYDEEEEEWL